MIYLVREASRGPMLGYLESGWASGLDRTMKLLTYEELSHMREFPKVAVIFSDLERFTPALRELATMLCERLEMLGLTAFNDPRRVLRRPELLKALYESGINTFRAVSAAEPLKGLKFPLFVREANEHSGNLTRLLRNKQELNWSLRMLTAFAGYRRRDLLVVEFCDTQLKSGMYAKYSAFRVGKRILPRCIEFGTHWMVKHTGRLIDKHLAEIELDYMQTHPHKAELEAIFERAEITYGRIDYALQNSRIQVWEINTNPQPAMQPLSWGGGRSQDLPDFPLRKTAKEMFFRAFTETLKAQGLGESGDTFPWRVSDDLSRRFHSQESALRRQGRVRTGLARIRRSGVVRKVARVLADRA